MCSNWAISPLYILKHQIIIHFHTKRSPLSKLAIASIVQNGILKQRHKPTMRFPRVTHFWVLWPTGENIHNTKITYSTTASGFIGHFSTILAHKSLKFVVLTHKNLYLSLGGPLPDLVQ
jgi:hypothetical protein